VTQPENKVYLKYNMQRHPFDDLQPTHTTLFTTTTDTGTHKLQSESYK